MKRFENVSYDVQANACYITVRTDAVVADTVRRRDDVMVDLDEYGEVVGIEILNANQHHDIMNVVYDT